MSFKEGTDAFKKLNESNLVLKETSTKWLELAGIAGQQYTLHWLGQPIIQISQDVVRFNQIASQVLPSLIIETGIARGGSLAFSASLLCLLDLIEGLDPRQSPRKVVGVDIDIRPHNRKALDKHPLRFKMELIE